MNSRTFISLLAWACIFAFISRLLFDFIVSYINYRYLLKTVSERQKELLNYRFKYGDLPGERIVNYNAEDFIKKYKNDKIDVIDYDKFYINDISHTYINSNYICINDEVIVPLTYTDYLEIISFICKRLIVTHNIKKEVNNSDYFYHNFYTFMYSLKKSNYFGDNIKDIISFDIMPKKYSEKSFIYYDEEDKVVYTYGFIMTPFIEMIILSYFKLKDILKYSNIEGYLYSISRDIYNYVNTIPTSQTYTVSTDISENLIEATLGTIVTGYDKDDKLIEYLRNWKSNNYAKSFWESLPTQIEIEYEEMFGKEINS